MLERVFPNLPIKWKAFFSISGCLLVNFSIALFYLWSSINIYVVSYFRLHDSPSLQNSSGVIFLPLYTLTISTAGLFSMKVVKAIGITKALLCSGMLVALCTFISSYMGNIYSFMIFFAVLEGGFVGVLNIIPLHCSNSYFPRNKGLANGVLQTGFGIGGVIFNLISLKTINPENLIPSKIDPLVGDKYFDEKVADRTPVLMRYIALYQLGLMTVAALLIFSPPNTNPDNKPEVTAVSEIQIGETLLEPEIEDKGTVKQANEDDKHEHARTLTQGLTSKAFLLSFLMCFLSASGCYMVSINMKNYGITQIPDDEFVTYISSVASFLNGATRILWGYIFDKIGFKKFYGTTLIIQIITLLLYCPLAQSRVFFAITNIVMMNLLGIQFCIFIPLWSHIFHPEIATTLVAFGFYSYSFACLIQFLLVNFLNHLINFVTLVWIQVLFSLVSFCILLYYKKPPDYKH